MPIYFVATPIGNLEDLTLRAIRVIEEADMIAAEDTRRTLKLLNHLGIKKPLISYYRENERARAKELIERAKRGENVAVVSDAGMPLISDPGEWLMKEAVNEGVEVTVIPGPSAALTALALSALSVERFAFEGFLPRETKQFRERLKALASEARTMIIYESPARLGKTLNALSEALGAERPAAVLRELTKLHEEASRATLSQLALCYAAPPKGECVIVVEGKTVETAPPDEQEIEKRLGEALGLGASRSEAVKQVSKELGVSKNAVYRLLHS